jgi:hypothetical protein
MFSPRIFILDDKTDSANRRGTCRPVRRSNQLRRLAHPIPIELAGQFVGRYRHSELGHSSGCRVYEELAGCVGVLFIANRFVLASRFAQGLLRAVWPLLIQCAERPLGLLPKHATLAENLQPTPR